MNNLSLEQSLAEYSKFVSWIDKYIPEKRASALKYYFGEIELSLTSSPYSIIKDQVGAFAGGYIVTINKLVESALILDKLWDKFSTEKYYTIEELVFSAVVCEIGKLGTSDEPFFLQNDNDWEIKNRGILYKYNPIYTNLKYCDKALFILQQKGFEISENEYLAIKLYNSLMDQENNFYFRRDVEIKSNLHFILNQAHQIVTKAK